MENKIIVQKMNRVDTTPLERAIRYYSILSAFNGIHLTEREIQLIAFTSIKGNISYSVNKEEFCKLYNSSNATIHNMISKLKKTNILVKDLNSKKIKVNPLLVVDFNKQLILQIKLFDEKTT